MIAWLKVGGILAALALIFGSGFYLGGLKSKTALEGFQAAQAENTAKAVLAERSATAAQLTQQQKVISTYEANQLDPLAPVIARRVFVTASARSCPVPEATSHAAGAPAAPTEPAGPNPIAAALGDLLAACAHDAAELSALQALSPR